MGKHIPSLAAQYFGPPSTCPAHNRPIPDLEERGQLSGYRNTRNGDLVKITVHLV